MSWSVSDRFPSWGETGESPGAGFFYEGGDQVNEKHLDYLWNSLKGLEDDVQAALSDIDSDSDGIVDEAATVTSGGSLQGDLQANNGETIWDESANYIPQARLQNDSITVNGNTVSLGGSTTIGTYSDADARSAINTDSDHGSTAPHNYFSGDHADLTGVGANDHHSQDHDNSDHTTNYLAQSNYNPEVDTHPPVQSVWSVQEDFSNISINSESGHGVTIDIENQEVIVGGAQSSNIDAFSVGTTTLQSGDWGQAYNLSGNTLEVQVLRQG
jgi:hypothetical protein